MHFVIAYEGKRTTHGSRFEVDRILGRPSGRSAAFEVEFVAASGRTQALLTLGLDDLRPVGDQDLIAVRSLAESTS